MKDRRRKAGLTRSDLKAFPNEVADAVLALVNNHGVRFRQTDGRHILLYPPDGVTRPFKVSASRRSEASINFIREQFCKPHNLEQP